MEVLNTSPCRTKKSSLYVFRGITAKNLPFLYANSHFHSHKHMSSHKHIWCIGLAPSICIPTDLSAVCDWHTTKGTVFIFKISEILYCLYATRLWKSWSNDFQPCPEFPHKRQQNHSGMTHLRQIIPQALKGQFPSFEKRGCFYFFRQKYNNIWLNL